MVTLSGFADEISADLAEQLDTLESLDVKYLELRGVWNKNVLALSSDELDQVRAELRRRGIGVSAIGSPIGKVRIDSDFEEYKSLVQHAIDVTVKMDTPYIRMFSFYVNDLDQDRDEVMRRMQAMVDMAAQQDVTMLHENEKGIYGERPERCLDLHQTITGRNFRATFDPANFVQAGVRPFDDAYPLLESYIEYLHIKARAGSFPPARATARCASCWRLLKSRAMRAFFPWSPISKSRGTHPDSPAQSCLRPP
jgi:3-dehydroshikimate dehydratase